MMSTFSHQEKHVAAASSSSNVPTVSCTSLARSCGRKMRMSSELLPIICWLLRLEATQCGAEESAALKAEESAAGREDSLLNRWQRRRRRSNRFPLMEESANGREDSLLERWRRKGGRRRSFQQAPIDEERGDG